MAMVVVMMVVVMLVVVVVVIVVVAVVFVVVLFIWLPGFALVPYYAPSPCHMHTVHNCHHIESFHPPVKQYTTTHRNTEFKYYTCSLFFICNTKVSRARSPLLGVLCNAYWPVSSSVYTSLEVSLPSYLIPRYWPVSSSGYIP